jgi:carboxymethylenebutenolidase
MAFAGATGDLAPTTLYTCVDGLTHGSFRLPTKAGEIDAYYARPEAGDNVPIVLVVQEIFGLHAHIRDVVRRLAKLGYFAVAANLYERQGDAARYTEIPALVADIVSKVSDEQVYADLDASMAWAVRQGGDPTRVGITGFCWGGRLTWMYAEHHPSVRAAVAWYGRLTTRHGPLIKRNPVDVASRLKAPVLGLYGGLDQSIPQEDVKRMRMMLAVGNAQARASEIVVYPKADHAFYADYQSSYRAVDAADAWSRLTAWFARYLT